MGEEEMNLWDLAPHLEGAHEEIMKDRTMYESDLMKNTVLSNASNLTGSLLDKNNTKSPANLNNSSSPDEGGEHFSNFSMSLNNNTSTNLRAVASSTINNNNDDVGSPTRTKRKFDGSRIKSQIDQFREEEEKAKEREALRQELIRAREEYNNQETVYQRMMREKREEEM